MKKRVFLWTAIMTLVVSMTACGSENINIDTETNEHSEVNTNIEVITPTTDPTVTESPTAEPTEAPEPTPTAPIEIDVSSVVRTDTDNYRWSLLEINYGLILENKCLYEENVEAKEEWTVYQQMTEEERIMYVVTDLDKLSVALNTVSDNTWVLSPYMEMLTEHLSPALYELRTEDNLEFLYGEDAQKAENAMFDVVCNYNLDYDYVTEVQYVKSYPTGEYTVNVLVECSTGKAYPYEFVVQTKDVASPNECHDWSETGLFFTDRIRPYLTGNAEPYYYK